MQQVNGHPAYLSANVRVNRAWWPAVGAPVARGVGWLGLTSRIVPTEYPPESAELDLKDLRSDIVKNFSAATWQKTFQQTKASIRNLASFPLLEAIPDELQTLNLTQYRQVVSGMNRIIYEVRKDTIYVHLIVDSRRDLLSFLMLRLVR